VYLDGDALLVNFHSMQRITVRNFNAIQSAEIDIANFTVIIGDHATGKSTLAKLVYFFKSIVPEVVSLSSLPLHELTERKLINTIQSRFYLFFGSTRQLASDYSIVFRYDTNTQITLHGSPLSVEFNDTTQANLIRRLRASAPIIAQYRESGQVESFIREEIRLKQEISNIFGEYAEVKFIPDGRSITVKLEEKDLFQLQKMLTEPIKPIMDEHGNLVKRNDASKINRIIMRDYIFHVSDLKNYYKGSNFKAALEGIDIDDHILDLIQNRLLKAKYKNHRTNGEYLELLNRQTISLENTSSGQQESIRLAQDIVYSISKGDQVFRVIEEPEAHLSPIGQDAIMKLLFALVNKTSNREGVPVSQVLITTHSPYVLSIMNNLMYAGELDLNRVDTHIPKEFLLHPSQVSAYMIDQDGNCVSMIDPESHLIGENFLENCFTAIQDEFDTLLNHD
jgi:AAA15 family ATPase/GTPase